MRITKTHFIDAGEKNAEGCYDYYYEGNDYTVAFDDVVYHCRTYQDEPAKLAFTSQLINGVTAQFKEIPYSSASFITCLKYFQAVLGFTDFVMLSEPDKEYVPVNLGKIDTI